MKTIIALNMIIILGVVGCAHNPMQKGRSFLDSSTHSDKPPSWVTGGDVRMSEGRKTYFHLTETIRGDERVSGCFDLARMSASERIFTELGSEIKGRIDSAQTSLNENAEQILAKMRSGQWEGKLSGLRFKSEYFERYEIGDIERVDCHVLAEIDDKDMSAAKQKMLSQLVEADPKIKDAIIERQLAHVTEQKKEE